MIAELFSGPLVGVMADASSGISIFAIQERHDRFRVRVALHSEGGEFRTVYHAVHNVPLVASYGGDA